MIHWWKETIRLVKFVILYNKESVAMTNLDLVKVLVKEHGLESVYNVQLNKYVDNALDIQRADGSWKYIGKIDDLKVRYWV